MKKIIEDFWGIGYNKWDGMKNLKDGKSTTLTIKVTQKTRDRAKALYDQIDSNMTFSSFLGEMVIKGLAFEEIWREKERTAIEEFAGKKVDIPPRGPAKSP